MRRRGPDARHGPVRCVRVDLAALPSGVRHLADGRLQTFMCVGYDEFDASQTAADCAGTRSRTSRLGWADVHAEDFAPADGAGHVSRSRSRWPLRWVRRSGGQLPWGVPVMRSTSSFIRRRALKPIISRTKSVSAVFSSMSRRVIVSSVIVGTLVGVDVRNQILPKTRDDHRWAPTPSGGHDRQTASDAQIDRLCLSVYLH